jgi:hypothetical protein
MRWGLGVFVLLCLQVRASLQEYTLEAQAEQTADGRQAVKLRKDSKVTKSLQGRWYCFSKGRHGQPEQRGPLWWHHKAGTVS